jgi:hypothetical protein
VPVSECVVPQLSRERRRSEQSDFVNINFFMRVLSMEKVTKEFLITRRRTFEMPTRSL